MRDPLDRYMTPRHVARAVVSWMQIPPRWTILEPSVGHGVWLDELATAGHQGHTIAYDVWDGALGLTKARESHHRDFLTGPNWAEGTTDTDLVLGNPPFKLAVEFVERSLQLCPRVALLLRSTFVEATEKRAPFWRDHRCVGEWTIGDRLRFEDHEGRASKGTDSVCHSVFFFERPGHNEVASRTWPRTVLSIERAWWGPEAPAWRDHQPPSFTPPLCFGPAPGLLREPPTRCRPPFHPPTTGFIP